MEMLSAFTDVLHVSNLGTPKHLEKVLQATNTFNQKEVGSIVGKLANHRICIGIKKLLGLLDMVKQLSDQSRAIKFISKLEEEGYAEPQL